MKRIPADFYELVKKWYGFLESQYGFRLRIGNSVQPRHAADGMVNRHRFHGHRDRRGPAHQRGGESAPALHRSPGMPRCVRPVSLLNQPAWRVQGLATFEALETCLEAYAGWLKEHAGLCLSGDFSRWPAFYEYKLERACAESLRRGEDELVRALVKDAEGSWQVIKRPLFADQREHIERLRKESAA